MSHTQILSDFKLIKDYDVVMITGGEPMLYPELTVDLVKRIRLHNPKCKIYLYTAYHKSYDALESILSCVDGIQYSLHAEATPEDIKDFHIFQGQISHYKDKSFRLFIDNRIVYPVNILPSVWKRVEVKGWLTEKELLEKQPNGLPDGEKLFMLGDLTIPKPTL